MARIVLITNDAGGNAAPLWLIGPELARRGHEVHVIGELSQRPAATGAGLSFAAHGEPSSVTRVGTTGDTLATMDSADVVVIDALLVGALQAAQRRNVRTVALFHTFYGFFTDLFATSPLGRVSARRGFDARALWSAADLCLVVSDRELDPGSNAVPANVSWTGPTLPTPLTPAVGNDRRALLSLSTVRLDGQQESMQRILDAIAGVDMGVLATVGTNFDRSALDVPANVVLIDTTPHVELMPQVSQVIGHGGHGTTMLALAHGLPLVIVPQFEAIDQRIIGAAVQSAGAGLTVSRDAATEDVRSALSDVADNPAHRAAAQAIGNRLRASNGTGNAATAIEAVADPQRSTVTPAHPPATA